MIKKYEYHGLDITLDIMDKIRDVVDYIANKENKKFEEAYYLFAKSNTYNSLINTDTLMWSESSGFIVDEYYRENLLDIADN